MFTNVIKFFSLFFSIAGAIFFGILQGKKKEQQKQQIEKIEQENENLKQIIEVEKTVNDMSSIDLIEFLHATRQKNNTK